MPRRQPLGSVAFGGPFGIWCCGYGATPGWMNPVQSSGKLDCSPPVCSDISGGAFLFEEGGILVGSLLTRKAWESQRLRWRSLEPSKRYTELRARHSGEPE